MPAFLLHLNPHAEPGSVRLACPAHGLYGIRTQHSGDTRNETNSVVHQPTFAEGAPCNYCG